MTHSDDGDELGLLFAGVADPGCARTFSHRRRPPGGGQPGPGHGRPRRAWSSRGRALGTAAPSAGVQAAAPARSNDRRARIRAAT